MKILLRHRREGKTTELIKESFEKQIYILAPNRRRADDINRQAERLGLYIPNPVTIEDYRRTNGFQGSFINEILIDDADDVLQTIFSRVEIKTITMTDREPKEECEFCKTIYPVEDTSDIAFQRGKYKDFSKDNYIYADEDGTFNIEAQAGDPYESGIVENIKYCPYCGRKLESEDKKCTAENQKSE